MLEQDSPKLHRRRIAALLCFFLMVLSAFVGVLYDTQITNGGQYLEQSVHTITKTRTVEASRGIITDRNGQVLVGNRQTYDLTFDTAALDKEDDLNTAVLRLVQLLRSQGLEWEDNLPVSRAWPYTYLLEDIGSTQRSRFVTFLREKLKLVSPTLTTADLSGESLTSAGLSANVLMAEMRTAYAIPDAWTTQDIRDVLGVLYELTIRQLINTTDYIMLRDLDTGLLALIKDGSYLGASIVSSAAREYKTDYAAHILGTVGGIENYTQELKEQGYAYNDIIGRSGAEAAFESYLKGTDGKQVYSTNSDGKITEQYYTKEPQPGSTVELTIDLDFQQAVEEALAATVSRMSEEDGNEKRGAGVAVVEVGTGAVLSLASYPTFHLATYNQDFNELMANPANPMLNRATQGAYPPGSTFKPLTAVAALESGVITPAQKIKTLGRYTYYAPTYQPACWIYNSYRGTHGSINVVDAINVSCNYFFYEVGRLTGISTLNRYARAFGLGEHTGIEIGDRAGVLAGPDYCREAGKPWSDGQTIAAAIGQSYNLFTPLQLANYIATLVSGGEHYEAHLLKEVSTYDRSQVLYTQPDKPVNSVEMAPSTLNAVKTGMYKLTTSGSLASYFQDCVVDAGAKTGTAQLGGDSENNGVFVCFAPYDDPEIAVAIVIEQGGSGSALASTAVEILNAWFTADQTDGAIIGENQLIP
ncbi:MAG: penicillin-binding protein A [Ruminococcaceae bacterium]|nr:penicillin-binding protein A [Oscillospiraceae bacterium]